MYLELPHGFDQGKALEITKLLLIRLRSKHDEGISRIEERWVRNTDFFSFNSYGRRVAGSIIVEKDSVVFNVLVPPTLTCFEEDAKAELKAEWEKLARE